MKTKIFFIIILALISLISIKAQQTGSSEQQIPDKTTIFKVWGNCEACKARIEKAAKLNGVIKAEWNQKTKLLTLVYDPSKVKVDDVQKKIAAAGHDTEKYKADDKTYKSLPACCQYERKK